MRTRPYPARGDEFYELYNRAKAEQWNAATDIDWRREPVFEERVSVEVGRAFNQAVVSQIAFGEHAALDMAGALVPQMDTIAEKLCLAVQVVDEARHLEVFGRYCELMGGMYDMPEPFQVLFDDLRAGDSVDELVAGLHVFMDGISVKALRSRQKQTIDPILKDVFRLVVRDEVRHVDFGSMYMERRLPGLSDAERGRLEERMQRWWELWAAAVRYRDETIWPTVPKIARRLFNRQITMNLREEGADLALRAKRLGLAFDPERI